MRCAICFGEHETGQHRKSVPTLLKDGQAVVKCPGCMRDVTPKELKRHKKLGCASCMGAPTATLGSQHDDGIHNPD